MSGETYGWVDGERVPLAMPEATWPEDLDDEGLDADGSAPEARAGGWWPSDSSRILWLGTLSRREAGEISATARRELVWWLAGDGLHPLRWARRWTQALWRMTPEKLPAEAGALWGANSKFEREVMGAFFSMPRDARAAARERKRLDGVFDGLGSRLRPAPGGAADLESMRDGEAILRWCGWEGPEDEGEEAATEAAEVARIAMVSLLRWVAEDGGWCLGALKRYYVAIFVEYRDLAPRMTGEDWGAIYGQTRAAFCEDAKRYIGLPLELELGYRPKVAGQKSAEAAEAYAENAREHCPRRQTGPVNHTEEDKRAISREDEARLRTMRAEAERREMERDAEEMRVRALQTREKGRVRGFSK
jgi:hypothetical protein